MALTLYESLDSKSRQDHNPSCPHLLLTFMEWVYKLELNRDTRAKAVTWGNGSAPAPSWPVLSINCDLYLAPHLRTPPRTADCEDASRLGGRQRTFSYGIERPIRRWKAVQWIDYFFFQLRWPLGQVWYKLNNSNRGVKEVLEIDVWVDDKFSKTERQTFPRDKIT